MAKKLSRFQKIREDAQAVLDERAGRSQVGFSGWQRFVHFWVLVGRSFARNRCPVRASALAYATALALIPMLAVVMSITSAILKKQGEKQILLVRAVLQVSSPAARSPRVSSS